MITYKDSINPLFDCICFIELYVNQKSDYKELEKNFVNQEEYINALHELHHMCEDIGKAFTEAFPNDKLLFTYITKEKEISPIKCLLFTCIPYRFNDYHVQIEKLRSYIQDHPFAFLQEIIELEKEDVLQNEYNEARMVQIFDELTINDHMKWSLWKLHMNTTKLLDTLLAVMDCVMPIYKAYKDTTAFFTSYYHYERNKDYEQLDLYQYILKSLAVQSDDDNIVIIPTAAFCRRIVFISKEENIVFYGVGTAHRFLENSNLSEELLCSTLKLLSDRSKFDILRFIAKEKAYGAQIANKLHLSTPTISYHMQALMNAQLVSFEKDNNRLYYQMNREYLLDFLKQVEAMLLQ